MLKRSLLKSPKSPPFRYQFQSSLGQYETKEAVFSDADNVWTDVRHLHMREAIEKLMVDFNAFLKENGVFNKGYVLLGAGIWMSLTLVYVTGRAP